MKKVFYLAGVVPWLLIASMKLKPGEMARYPEKDAVNVKSGNKMLSRWIENEHRTCKAVKVWSNKDIVWIALETAGYPSVWVAHIDDLDSKVKNYFKEV